MSFNGNISTLKTMARAANSLPFAVRNRVAIAVTKEINALLEEQFDQGIDPSGEPWKPLAESTKRRGRTPPPLTDTRVMRDQVKAVRVGTNIAINSELPAAYHQHGAGTRLPKRPIWPDPAQPMPDRYSLAMSLVGNAAALDAVKSSGLMAAE